VNGNSAIKSCILAKYRFRAVLPGFLRGFLCRYSKLITWSSWHFAISHFLRLSFPVLLSATNSQEDRRSTAQQMPTQRGSIGMFLGELLRIQLYYSITVHLFGFSVK
jgi:hypothetical protein